jgi:hypothetical protein
MKLRVISLSLIRRKYELSIEYVAIQYKSGCSEPIIHSRKPKINKGRKDQRIKGKSKCNEANMFSRSNIA